MEDIGLILDEEIFPCLDEDEYAQAAESALEYLKNSIIPEDYVPYVTYIKLFADSYRVWQISYDYSQIRNGFKLAAHMLRQQLEKRFRDGLSGEHRILLEAFENLSRMLCEYTWCENSLITNDPFALLEHSRSALDLEDAALRILKTKKPFGDATLGRIRTWLAGYLKKNRLLHSGLNACADIYIRILRDHSCPAGLYRDRIKKAENSLRLLEKESSELASELHAHIEHIKRHYQRTNSAKRDFSYLAMKEGSVVLCMSGTCLIELARDAIEEEKAIFWQQLKNEFGKLGIVLKDEDHRELKLHDVFQTSFGEHYLKSFTFNLPDTRVTFLNGATYRFATSIVISAFGVCTVKFSFDVTEKNARDKGSSTRGGLPVEILRALQSCICPHAGQTRIDIDTDRSLPGGRKSGASPIDRLFIRRIPSARFVNQLDIVGFLDVLSRTDVFLKARPTGTFDENLLRATESIREKTRMITQEMVDNPLNVDHVFKSIDHEKYANEYMFILDSLLEYSRESRAAGKEDPEAESIVLSLASVSQSFSYLRDLVEYYLEAVGRAFLALVNHKPDLREFLIPPVAKASLDEDEIEKDDALDFRHDTGWYTYVYAGKIDLIPRRGRRRSVMFDEIVDHPDTKGIIIEQREARASFDDWRFMHSVQTTERDENLAHIRSHNTDAFFASEYQAFIFLPDDPRFLTDQYEATIELMIRLVSAIRFYSRAADESSHKMHASSDHSHSGGDLKDKLERDYRDLRHIRWLSKELPILVSKAGISRYKDHGELMRRLVQNMKMDRIVGVLEQHWENIDQMYSQKLRQKQSQIQNRLVMNEKKSRRNIGLLTFLIATAAIPGLVEHFMGFNPSALLSRDSVMIMVSFVLMLIVVILAIRWYLGIEKQEREMVNQKADKDFDITLK